MDKITRRDFLEIGAGLAIISLLPKSLFGAEEGVNRPLIGVAHGRKSKLVKAAVDLLGGMDKFVKNGDTVCLKPNISFAANADCGATTSVEITKQVVQLCLDAGAAKIIIIDHTIQDSVLCVAQSGIEQAVIDKKKVSIFTPTKERQFAEVEVPKGKSLKSVMIPKVIQAADKLINLPVAKSHSATGVSLGMKNLMGLIWDRNYLHQMNLHQAIAELATIIKPSLTIIDATRALTSGGPGGPGNTVELNMVIVGTDVVAVDSYAVGITPWYNKSFTGSKVKYLVAASEMGLGEINVDKMQIKKTEV